MALLHPLRAMVAPFRGAYLDDIFFAAPASQAATIFSVLVGSLASIGLEVNLTKCEVILGSSCTDASAIAHVLPCSCFRRHTSWGPLGAPCGDRASVAAFAARDAAGERLQRVTQLATHGGHTQAMLVLLRFCVGGPHVGRRRSFTSRRSVP